MELLGANHDYYFGKENLTYALLVMLEEGLEMFGVATFLYALSSYMASHAMRIQIVMGESAHDRPTMPPM